MPSKPPVKPVSEPVGFYVRLHGPGASLASTPFRRVGGVLNAVQRLIEQPEDPRAHERDPEVAPVRNALTLLDLREGSAVYGVAAQLPAAAMRQVRRTGRDLEAIDGADWTAADVSALSELSRVAKAQGVVVELREAGPAGELGPVVAAVGPGTGERVRAAAFVRQRTSLYGVLKRVGGATATRCAVRAPGRRSLIYCGVRSEPLARALGRYVYRPMTLHGEAVLVGRRRYVHRFRVESFDPHEEGSLVEALREVHAAGGDGWDGVEDPAALIYGGDA